MSTGSDIEAVDTPLRYYWGSQRPVPWHSEDPSPAFANAPSEADIVVIDTDEGATTPFDGLSPLTPVVGIGSSCSAAEYPTAPEPAAIATALHLARRVAARVGRLAREGIPGRTPSLEALLLAYAWTRDRKISPRIHGEVPGGWTYPALARFGLTATSELVGIADGLRAAGALRAVPEEVALPCPKCASVRVLFRDACGACGSPHVSPVTLVHHFKCAHQAPENAFIQSSGRYVCPKCRRELRHFGLDYDKPGEHLVCAECGIESPEARAHGRCLDCGETFPADACVAIKINSFELTGQGEQMLADGHVDWGTIADAVSSAFPAVPVAGFLTQLRAMRAVEQRHGLPSCVLRVGFATETTHRLDPIRRARLTHHAGQLLIDTIRETDLLTQWEGDVILLLVGTSDENGEQTAKRLKEQLRAGLGETLAAGVVVEVSASAAFLERLTPSLDKVRAETNQ